MIRFEIPPKTYSRNIRNLRWLGFVCGILIIVSTIFLSANNRTFLIPLILIGVNLILGCSPFQPKKLVRFVEINDKQIKWNNTEEYNNKLLSDGPEKLDWLEITRIKKLRHNELMFFVENSFYRRLWLNDYTPNEQQVILDTIKAYAERLSLIWVEEGPVAAVA